MKMADGTWKCTVLEERSPDYSAGKLPAPDHRHKSREEATECAEARIADAEKYTQRFIQKYFVCLFERLKKTEPLRFDDVSLGDWEPEPSRCHANVEFWKTRHPQLEVMRGWLVQELEEIGRYQLTAHSLLDDHGCLIDITLRNESDRVGMRFLRHGGSDKEFFGVEAWCRQIMHPPLTRGDYPEVPVAPVDDELDEDEW